MARGSLGSVLSALPERRNRFVLYSVARRTENAPVELEVLVREVAGWEQSVPPESVADESFEVVITDLVRNRLPDLSRRGLVEFDPLSGLVGRPNYTLAANLLVAVLARIELASRF